MFMLRAPMGELLGFLSLAYEIELLRIVLLYAPRSLFNLLFQIPLIHYPAKRKVEKASINGCSRTILHIT
jgi:hypothetical protein